MQDDRKSTTLILVLIGLAALVAYAPALQAGFIWDDDAYILENKTLQSLSGISDIWFNPPGLADDPGRTIPQYYPLVHTTFWIEYRFWGTRPFGYHLVNVLLHITSTVLLFFVVRRLALPGALLVAGVFALHPVMVESVAWVTERKNVLSMGFYLLTLLAYLRYERHRGSAAGATRQWWIAFGLFFCAVTSKSVTFSLPFTILLIFWWKRGRIVRADVRPLVPFMLLGVLYGVATTLIEKHHVGATGAEWGDTFAQKCLIAGRVPWFYLSKLFWPTELTFIYERWVVDPGQAWQYLYPLATVVLIVALRLLVRRIGRGPLAAVLMFGGTLFPAIGFISVYPFRYSYVADHFQYHASLGIIVLVSAVLARAVPKAVGLPVAVVVLALFGYKTLRQSERFEGKEVLYNSILADDPGSWFAHNNLGAIYVLRDEEQKGFDFYRRAKELYPMLDPGPSVSPDSYAHCMVGKMMGTAHSLRPWKEAARQQRWDEVARLKAALEPWWIKVARHFESSIELSPDYVDALFDCGRVYLIWAQLTSDPRLRVKRFLEAVNLLEGAFVRDPEWKGVRQLTHNLHMMLADIWTQDGQQENANRHRARAHELRRTDPDGPRK